jgi:hypothetical protein
MSEQIHRMCCQNCMAMTDCRAVDAPDGNEYWVCRGCVGLVESGDALCVQHGVVA